MNKVKQFLQKYSVKTIKQLQNYIYMPKLPHFLLQIRSTSSELSHTEYFNINLQTKTKYFHPNELVTKSPFFSTFHLNLYLYIYSTFYHRLSSYGVKKVSFLFFFFSILRLVVPYTTLFTLFSSFFVIFLFFRYFLFWSVGYFQEFEESKKKILKQGKITSSYLA